MLIVKKIDTQDQILTLKTVNKNFKNRQQNAVVHQLARMGLYTVDLTVSKNKMTIILALQFYFKCTFILYFGV